MTKLDGKKLLNARLDKGFSQEKTAKLAGVSLNTYNRAERGGTLHPDNALQITKVLDVKLADVRISSDEVDDEVRSA